MSVNGVQRTYDVVETDTGLKRLADSHYQPFFSQNARERKPSAIRSLFPLEQTPGIISLLAGKPNPTMFPITSLSFSARSPTSSSLTEEQSFTLSPEEMAIGLQYGATAGIPPLREWIYGLQEKNHGRKKGEGWSVFVGSGSQDLIYKAVQALVDDGDSVLIESPVYSGVLPMFQSLHCELIGKLEIQTDADGISTSSLRSVLENWPSGKKRPKVLYTVPYGCNPTGMTATLERRKEVLKLARKYDLIILEDDPYFYLYYGTAPRVPSYFSLEKDLLPEVGRVLRFDSFSKVLSAGIRVGFASGPDGILTALEKHTATSNLQTSSLTQVIVNKLLQAWGHDGFKTHTERVAAFYEAKRDMFQKAMEKYLDGYAEWVKPEAGMFFWYVFKLKLPNNNEADEGDSESVIRGRAFDKGVLALPGKVFLPNGNSTAYVRASFSINPEEEVYEALRRLREALDSVRAEL
ncbi:PLP-dependent transferase [Macrolepiota fuliginosa MF-IS2]|uniref:PLP-dependent transferase n=1 Tax=Macrolepiota fuliginosa MF-IS2 TaxID=1400762 RepID=A0A9P5X9G1_9AGAR|nr:PLP-dependent transferase [Macrolepiota fuliginosa MF-IS2]